MTGTPAEAVTHSLERPGATITYDVRENAASSKTPLFMIGHPMSASGFVTLASHFTDRRVITYDPRGFERSVRTDRAGNTADLVADELHAVIEALGGGPVDMFASSGGAITALALVARHPNDLRKLVAHEPPLTAVLPDNAEAKAAVMDIVDTYQSRGGAWGMAKFMAVVTHQGEIPPDWAARPAPDPQMFGMPSEDDGKRDDPMMASLVALTSYEPDIAAIKAAPTRVVIAGGEDEPGTMANRGAHGIAQRLGSTLVNFPGGHGGFLGGEYGQMGKPDEFAKKLHEVID
ncbi:MAG: alpha/beta hydrolase [Candidatus Limnocylindrales bacterium]